MEEKPTYDGKKQWAIVALMGHTKIAGQVSEHNLGGTFLRVDVPPVDGRPGFTKLIGHSAIFDLTFVTEEIARAAAKAYRAEPVSSYELPELRQLRLGAGSGSDDPFAYDPDDPADEPGP